MLGKVLSTLGDTFTILGEDKVLYNVFSKGVLRFRKNNIIVGDNVELNDNSALISSVFPRNNELIRPHIANIDQLLIVMSVKEPNVSPYLIYKYLSYANFYKIPSIVLFSKVDNEEDKLKIEKLTSDLSSIGVQFFLHSKNDASCNEKLDDILKNKTTALMGQTGSGKSSLINDLNDSFARKVGDYSVCLGRGKHTTKEVILLPYLGGFIADTPGFSSLDLDFYKEDLAKCFPGFSLFGSCFYTNCLHLNEKECVVKKEIKNHISEEQYQIYIKLLAELKAKREKYL